MSEIQEHTSGVQSVAFSPDGQTWLVVMPESSYGMSALVNV